MFIPQEGNYLTINLPGETLRAIVEKLVTPDSIIAKIASQPMAKAAHSYKMGDFVACRRQRTMMGEAWEAADERRPEVKELVKQEKEAAPKKEPKQETSKKEKKDAAGARKFTGKNLKKHIGNDKVGIPKKSSNRSIPLQRKASPKGR